jgi:nucleoid-associated protein YgaU
MRRIRGLAALIVLVALVVGIPLALASTIGNPLHAWSDLKAGDVSDAVVIDILAGIAYLAWAQFAISVLVEVAAATRHVPTAVRIPLVPSASQHLAHALVAAVLLIGASSATLATPLHTLADPQHRPAAVTTVITESTAPPAASAHPDRNATTPHGGYRSMAPPALPHATHSFVVPSGGRGPDTYWDIAAAQLGSGERWSEIWELNQGRTQADGSVMTTPGLLRPGWTVLIPAGPTRHTTSPQTDTVAVEPGDTLSGIASTYGVEDWHDVWEQNAGASEPGGRRFTDPNLILPGWTITVAAPSAHSATAPPATHPAPPAPPAGTAPSPKPAQPDDTPPVQPPPATPTQPPGTQSPEPQQRPPVSADPATGAPGSTNVGMVAFAAGGWLLAGVSLAALIRYRRRQFRWRRPGRAISATPPELQHVERGLLATGTAGIADVTWLDRAMRSLVQSQAPTGDARLPDVLAVRMTDDHLELVLSAPALHAPAPWTVDPSGTRWSVSRADELAYDRAQRGYHVAPFPTLVSIGYTPAGERWLLDLERVGTIALSGDSQRCLNLARFLAAELAHNAWSEMLRVTLVGFGEEMATINPERLTYTEDFAAAIGALAHDLDSVTHAERSGQVSVLDGRLRGIAADTWAPHVLLVAPHAACDRAGLDHLLAVLQAQRSRSAVAVVLTGDPSHAQGTRWQLTVDDHGMLHVPALGLRLIAQQIPAEEAAQLAHILALAATTDDRPVPGAGGAMPWDEYADAAGRLRITPTTQPGGRDARASAGVGAADVPAPHLPDSTSQADSVLPLSSQTYLDHTATTREDLESLAPPVDEATRRHVEDLDPDLDRDLAAWYDPACTQPKVSLLGPVTLIAQGALPQRNPRLLWNTEIVAYLATRPSGVSAERYGADMWPGDPDIAGKTKVRQSISIVRHWLGLNHYTGREHLPKGLVAGVASPYKLEGVLVDAELFRRLRLRGVARGGDGIPDLRAALDLVNGPPFSERRPDGYGWLAENPLDHIYAGMIVDVAHIVATHHLAAGEPEKAVAAAQVALRAGSSEDVPLLDLVAACDAQDNRAEADAYVKRILANHDAEVEEDLPPRTAEILFRRHWIDQAS